MRLITPEQLKQVSTLPPYIVHMYMDIEPPEPIQHISAASTLFNVVFHIRAIQAALHPHGLTMKDIMT